jgi:hypothetical protein
MTEPLFNPRLEVISLFSTKYIPSQGSTHYYIQRALTDIMRSLEITKYFSGDRIEKNEMSGHVARMGEKRSVYRVFVSKLEGKRLLARPSHRWEDNNNKMDLQEVGCGVRDWIDLAWDRDRWLALVKAVINLRFP